MQNETKLKGQLNLNSSRAEVIIKPIGERHQRFLSNLAEY